MMFSEVHDAEVQALLALHPVSGIQWLPRDRLKANDYNPNDVPPIEMDLLEQSILEDRFTQPIVVHAAGADGLHEIVDGFHRWTVADRPAIRELTAGYVPVVILEKRREDRMLSTIRHNRARGQHGIKPMAMIVRFLQESGMDIDEFGKRLGMEPEEVDRLAFYGTGGVMPDRASGGEFNKAWIPKASEKQKAKKAASSQRTEPKPARKKKG